MYLKDLLRGRLIEPDAFHLDIDMSHGRQALGVPLVGVHDDCIEVDTGDGRRFIMLAHVTSLIIVNDE